VRVKGFTLIELLIGLAVLGVLLGLAAPSMRDMLLNNRMTSLTNDLMYAIAAARSEAAKRGQRIVICKNETGAGANTACGTGAWTAGWVIYIDANSNNALDTGETIVRVHEALPSTFTVTPTTIADYVSVRPVGTIAPLGSFKVCDQRTGNFGRLISVAASGRASVTTVACP
jgi:type IV fimbrial biogenesis protein FimT